jgi:ribosomal protein S24E
LKYHNILEQKEINYRIQVSHNLDKRKSKKEIKKEIIETKKAYKNLYSLDNIDMSNNTKENNSSSSLNIIKINLASLEFEKLD